MSRPLAQEQGELPNVQVGGLGEGNRGQPRPLVRGSTRSRKVCLYFYTTSVYTLSASVFRPMCLDVGSLITLYTQKASASRCSTTSTITMLPHPCKKSPPGDVGRIAGIPPAFRARFSLPPAPGPSSARAGPSPPWRTAGRRVSHELIDFAYKPRAAFGPQGGRAGELR